MTVYSFVPKKTEKGTYRRPNIFERLADAYVGFFKRHEMLFDILTCIMLFMSAGMITFVFYAAGWM